MLVIVVNGVYVTLHSGCRRALERGAGRASGDTEVRNLAVGDIVHESCAWTGQTRERGNGREAHTMDKRGFEWSGLAMIIPLLTSSRAAAAFLFQVESIPVLRGPS